MPKKPRPDPYTQGSLANIDKWFIRPLVVYKPPLTTLSEWYEFLFDFSNRDIVRYVAHKEFLMPGLFYLTPFTKIQGIGHRRVSVGTELYVRKDARQPDLVDVEFNGGQGGADQVFALTGAEWRLIELNIQEAEREKKQ